MDLPSDIAYLDVEVPGAPLALAEPASHPERLRSCAGAIAGRLSQVKSPAILVDQHVNWYGAAAEVVGPAKRLQMPVAVTASPKAVIDETFPYYAGQPSAREERSIHLAKGVVALRPHLTGGIGDDDIRRVTGNEALEIPGKIASTWASTTSVTSDISTSATGPCRMTAHNRFATMRYSAALSHFVGTVGRLARSAITAVKAGGMGD